MIDLIGVPFDLCGRRAGSRLGPAALRLAELGPTLQGLGFSVEDLGDIASIVEDTDPEGLKGFSSALTTYSNLRETVRATLKRGRTPMVLGGDHSIAIGSVAGAIGVFGGDVAVLWIDAHVDLNTPRTSSSGNLHGMPVAALMGMDSGLEGPVDRQWSQLTEEVVARPALVGRRFAWIGLRDADEGERRAIEGLPAAFASTMQDIDRFGIERLVGGFDKWMRESGASRLWISFDVDVLDPILAPGTGTAVRGGLTYREAHLLAEIMREKLDGRDCPYTLVGLDLVETNPLYDTHNETARMAVEWIASLFGKTILGGPSRFGERWA